jgi:hypothetical protein
MPYILPNSRSGLMFIPACGSSWVRTAIVRGGIEYIEDNPYDVHGAYRPDGVDVLGVFVRDPSSWARSRWAKGPGIPDGLEDVWDREFEAFRGKFDIGAYFRNYAEKADFVGHQESLVEDFLAFLRLVGEEFDEDLIRATPRAGVTDWEQVNQGIFADGTRLK